MNVQGEGRATAAAAEQLVAEEASEAAKAAAKKAKKQKAKAGKQQARSEAASALQPSELPAPESITSPRNQHYNHHTQNLHPHSQYPNNHQQDLACRLRRTRNSWPYCFRVPPQTLEGVKDQMIKMQLAFNHSCSTRARMTLLCIHFLCTLPWMNKCRDQAQQLLGYLLLVYQQLMHPK